jgi:predicted alpha-1,2-mannosidase
LEKEISGWDFNAVRKDAGEKWEAALSTIQVKTSDEEAKTIFYTSLYHSLLEPTISSDTDGRYRTMENEIARDGGYTNYTVFSLWDTFRALNPLLTIAYPDKEEAFIRSLIRKYEEGGILPMWELASNYTGTMLGYHAVPLIVDAYVKGLRNFDVEKAYEACVFSSSYDTLNVSPTINRHILHSDLMSVGKQYKNTIGYIPSDKVNQSVAKGLEYAYNDWLIAQFAQGLGKEDDYAYYAKLGKNYTYYFDPSTRFMRGKLEDGSRREPFVPNASDHGRSDYCEGNAWQWAWFVPHDVEGLVALMGGREAFIGKLDSLFSVSSELVGDNVSADISGMIGQYAHGNEPSHQTVHLYNLVDQPWKTQELVDSILYSLYHNHPDGLSGNEDCGQMSAWYILNAMGFYSYCPGIPEYSVGRPVFDEASIRLKNGKEFVVRTINNSRTNKYVKSVKLNGKELDRPFFSHADLAAGGVLEIQMSSDKP